MVTASTALDQARLFYARLLAASSRSDDPRLERIFEMVPREAFLPPGPWKIWAGERYIETPSADPIHLYQNVLVALDEARYINNGEPLLHAAWIGAVAPQRGETICQIGAGSGYYTAILSMLVLPDGHVEAFEIDPDLARRAEECLRPFESVTVVCADATQYPLPECDILYVNPGVVAPPASWMRALRPGGRMIFPWRPSETTGLSVLVTRSGSRFTAEVLAPSWFIPCVGASETEGCVRTPTGEEARAIRSAWLIAEKAPDETAVAIYRDVWFSVSVPDLAC